MEHTDSMNKHTCCEKCEDWDESIHDDSMHPFCKKESCTCHTQTTPSEESKKKHICRFNDGEQTCDCYEAGVRDSLALIPEESAEFSYLSNDFKELARQLRKAISTLLK